MAAQTEDVPYSTPDFALPDPEKTEDPDQPNKTVLEDVRKYLIRAIKDHNSLDAIDLTETHNMTPTQQIAVQQLLVGHLRNEKSIIEDKIKELK